MNQKIRTAYEAEDFELVLKLIKGEVVSGSVVDFETYAYKGAALMHLAQYREAITAFDMSIALNDDYYANRVFRGDCYYELAEYERAASDYWISLQIDPTNGAAMDKLARSLFRLGDKKRAVEYILTAVMKQESAEPFIVAAHMFRLSGYQEYAARVMRRGAELFPTDNRFRELNGAKEPPKLIDQ